MASTSSSEPSTAQEHLMSLFTSGKFSDLTLKCGGRTFWVHKIIVCRSGFFANATKGNFKEATSGVIDFPEEEPEVLFAVLQFLYSDKYNSPKTTLVEIETDSVFHVKVYAAAEKYLIGPLKKLAFERFKWSTELAIYVIPHGSKLNPRPSVWLRGFVAAITAVYQTSLLDSVELKEIVLKGSSREGDMMFDSEEGRTFLSDNPDFAVDLGIKLSKLYAEVSNENAALKRTVTELQQTTPRPQTNKRICLRPTAAQLLSR